MRGSGAARRVAALIVVVLVGACTSEVPAPSSTGIASPPPSEAPRRAEPLAVSGIMEHLLALQRIARAHDGTRAVGTSGYDASVAYVARTLRASHYRVQLQRFDFPFFEQRGPATIATLSGSPIDLQDGRDFRAMIYSGSATVEAEVVPVGFEPDATGREGPGCSEAAYEGFPAGAIALLRPGPCFYRDQVEIAQDHGAAAVLLAFPDFVRGRVLRPTLISPDGIDVPVLGLADSAGRVLAAVQPRVRVTVDATTRTSTGINVLADLKGRSDRVVIVGGHLDSVIDGPGINDNGSGIATILELAEVVADERPAAGLRFAFWGGEELGLLGSSHYVEQLSSEEIERITAYLNFDMIASPNYGRFVYADAIAGEESQEITKMFRSYFSARDLETDVTDVEGRSDHGPFISVGVPVGGLFTGAEEIKAKDEVVAFGGRAGVAFDRCYHLPCDTLSNVNRKALKEMGGAIAHVVTMLAGL